MPQTLPGIDVLFIAGFGPVSESSDASTAFYVQTLGLPLKLMEGNADYLLTEESQLPGAKHFAVWPLSQAATSFGYMSQIRKKYLILIRFAVYIST